MFNIKFNIYGIMVLFSLLANVIVVSKISKKYSFFKDEIVGALLYENIGIIYGAKLLTFFTNYSQNSKFEFFKLGFSAYGALIGAIVCLVLFCLQFKKSIKDILCIFMPSIPMMYSIGKLGCFLVGCCYGIEYKGIGNIVYKYSPIAPNNIQLFPVQIIESIVFILIFIYMIIKAYQNKFSVKTLGISFILIGFAKFGLDYFRMSHLNTIISLNQKISVVFVLIGIYLCKKRKIDSKND